MNKTERRETYRLLPKDLTFVAMRPKFSKLGKLLNISGSGLCFQYMGQIGAQKDQAGNGTSFEVDMFVSDKEYYLPRVPCSLIYDTELERGMTFPIGLEYRCCGLKFKKFTKNQTDQLSLYLKNYTVKNREQTL